MGPFLETPCLPTERMPGQEDLLFLTGMGLLEEVPVWIDSHTFSADTQPLAVKWSISLPWLPARAGYDIWALWWQKVGLRVCFPFWWPENILWLASVPLLWEIWIIMTPLIFFIEKCGVCHRPLERMNRPVARNDQKQLLVHHSVVEICLQPLFP